jgi:hypothetical protein
MKTEDEFGHALFPYAYAGAVAWAGVLPSAIGVPIFVAMSTYTSWVTDLGVPIAALGSALAHADIRIPGKTTPQGLPTYVSIGALAGFSTPVAILWGLEEANLPSGRYFYAVLGAIWWW